MGILIQADYGHSISDLIAILPLFTVKKGVGLKGLPNRLPIMHFDLFTKEWENTEPPIPNKSYFVFQISICNFRKASLD